jgi:FKBP-type peptidyl-prolyl cis-trans isomerase (trigger factor)
VHVAEERTKKLVDQRLAEIAKSVRLPGFRPGKIPHAVLETRYGAKTRAEIIQRYASDALTRTMNGGEIASALELTTGAEAGDVDLRLTVTHLPDLPQLDIASLKFERFSATPSDLAEVGLTSETAQQLFDQQLREQVLDHLNAAYPVPLLPALVENEFAAIRQAAAEALASDAISQQERETLAATLFGIAERRVRLGALLVELGRRHQIHASPEEIETARREGESVRDAGKRTLEDKVVAWLVSQATISERAASLEDLRNLLDAEG